MVPRGDNKIAAKPLLHLFSDQWQEGKQNSPPSHLHTEYLCGWPNAIFYFLWRCLVNSTITEYIQQVQGESVVIEYCLKCSKQKLSLHMVTKLAAPFVWMCTSDLNAGVKLAHRMTLNLNTVNLPDLLCGDSTLFVPFKSSLQPFLLIKKENQYADTL